MRRQTMAFFGLILAMVVLLAYAWYTWPQPSQTLAAPETTNATATTSNPATAAASTTSAVGAPTVNASLYPPPSLGEHTSTLQIGGQTVYADLAENQAQQSLGLGNRSGLGAHQGMLFIFPNDEQHLFWMKDMSFSIDMIWMSDDGTVIYIQPNVSPQTYPEAFGPTGPSRYVLEVPANFAADHGITIGTKALLP